MHTTVYSIYGLYIYAAARTCIVHKRRRTRLIQFRALAHYTYALWHVELYLDVSDIWSIYSWEGLFHIMFDCGKFALYICCTLHIRTVWQTQYITHTSCCTRTGFRFRLDATTCCQHQQQCASEKVLFYCLFNKLNSKFKSKSRAIYFIFHLRTAKDSVCELFFMNVLFYSYLMFNI